MLPLFEPGEDPGPSFADLRRRVGLEPPALQAPIDGTQVTHGTTVVALRYAVRLNGITSIALTKLDVLSSFDQLPVCIAYELRDGARTDEFPEHQSDFHAARPVYETLEGWSESTRGARSWAQLPATAIKYIRRVEELIEAPVALLSTSPERDDTILVRDPFAD